MKAAVLTSSGFEIGEARQPVPGPEQVLVRVRACALNRADLGVISGHMHGNIGGPGTIPGMEFAGEVVEVGAGVKGIKVGDRVACSGGAGYAEYAVTDYGRVMPIASSAISYEQAVTLPIAVLTMHDAIVTNGRLRAGDAIVIQGASSGVGLLGMQIAKLMGAGLVIGTSSNPARRDQLTKWGADVALDNSDETWPAQAVAANKDKGIDVIIDQLSGKFVNQNMQAAAVLGRIVNVGRLAGFKGEMDFDLHALKRIQYIGVTFRTRNIQEVREIARRAMEDLGPAIQAGKLTLPIDKVFPFAQLADAFVRMRRNEHFGKIVVTHG